MEGKGIIPVVENKTIMLKPVGDVIYDTTGFSCTGFLKDEEILSLCDWSDWFPHPLLRDYDKYSLLPGIKGFLARYHSENQEFDVDVLHDACENEEFQKWLSNEVNNVPDIFPTISKLLEIKVVMNFPKPFATPSPNPKGPLINPLLGASNISKNP